MKVLSQHFKRGIGLKNKILLLMICSFILTIVAGFLYIRFTNFDTDEVIVAVLDSGVDYNHDMIKGKILPGIDVVDYDLDPMDEFGHGTHVSGIITSNEPKAKILPIRTLNENGINGYFPNGIVILYAILKGADIVNMSYSSKVDPSTTIAVKIGYAKGVIFVGAAGEEKSTGLKFPASLDEVIAVGTVKPSMKKIYERSNIGRGIDYLAPGVDIISADIEKPYLQRSGTSMSAAYLSGAIAYIKSHNKRVNSKNIKGLLDQDANIIQDQFTYNVIDFNKIKAVYENTPYFHIKEFSLEYKNAEFDIPYEGYFITDIKIFNNEKLVDIINPLYKKRLSVKLHEGDNLIRIEARAAFDTYSKELLIHKKEQMRIIEDRTVY